MGSSGWLEVSERVKRGRFVLKHSYLIRKITKQTATIMAFIIPMIRSTSAVCVGYKQGLSSK